MIRKTTLIVISTLLLLILLPFIGNATLVIPPDDIGEMVYSSDYVVYGKVTSHADGNPYLNNFQISDVIKGDFTIGQSILLKEYSSRSGDLISTISGDVDYKINQEYLLFLFKDGNGVYKANLLSLSVFENSTIDGHDILAHSAELLKLAFVGGINPDLTGAYLKDDFLCHLHKIADENQMWDTEDAGYVNDIYDAKSIRDGDGHGDGHGHGHGSHSGSRSSSGAPPAHCTVLFGDITQQSPTICDDNTPAKFEDNSWDLFVASGASTDPSNASAIADLQNAVNALNGMPGVTVSYNGVGNCAANCAASPGTGSASGAALDCNNNGQITNRAWVFFDDPCNEIDNLNNCGGTLGIGGHWSSRNCFTGDCGNMWRSSNTPFFVMNNGTGCLGDYQYTAVLIHELLHSISLGHIGEDSGDECTALLNASVCTSNSANGVPNFGITNLDEECTEFLYDDGGCNFRATGLTRIRCTNGGTPGDVSDDVIAFSLNPTGSNLGTTYTVSGVTGLLPDTPQSYGGATIFTLPAGSAGGGDVTITITDDSGIECTINQLITDPGSCFGVCSITETGITSPTCNNGGTPTNTSDDIITFSLNPTGMNLGATYTVSGVTGLLPNTAHTYGRATTFTMPAGSAGGGDVTVTITDDTGTNCTITQLISDPGSCSDACSITGSGIFYHDTGRFFDEIGRFSDENLNGIYVDTIPRRDTTIICPRQPTTQVLVTFQEFDLSPGDFLEVYDCDIGGEHNPTPSCPVLATATGNSVSSAFGGWVASNCDTTINNTGCLSFIFHTNGDNNKGTGWDAEITCGSKVVTINECPEDIVVEDDCSDIDGMVTVTLLKPEFLVCDGVSFGQVEITSTCNSLPRQVVTADGGTLGTFMIPLGIHFITATSTVDTSKTCTYQISASQPSLVCNNLVNVSRTDRGIGLRVDDILENPCTGPAVSYKIEVDTSKAGVAPALGTTGVLSQIVSGIDAAALAAGVLDLTEAFPFCESGDFPVTITRMVETEECFNGRTIVKEERCRSIMHIDFIRPDIFLASGAITSCGLAGKTDEEIISLISIRTSCNVDPALTRIIIEPNPSPSPAIPNDFCDVDVVQIRAFVTSFSGETRGRRLLVPFQRPTLIAAPLDITVNCESELDPNTTGFPLIDANGDGELDLQLSNEINNIGESCDYVPFFTDTDVSVSGSGTKTIQREWVIRDRCNMMDPIIRIQMIDIQGGDIQIQSTSEDGEGSISKPIFFSPNKETCTAKVHIEDPLVVTDCDTLLESDYTLIRNRVVQISTGAAVDISQGLPIGRYFIEYIVNNNISNQKDTAQTYFSVREEGVVAICNGGVNASYIGDKIAISIDAIDAAGTDACSASYKREIRREGTDEEWGDKVILNCTDFTEEVRISMRLTDDSGLDIPCWTNVSSFDYISPICQELEDLTYDCEQFHISDFGISTDDNNNQSFDEEEWISLFGAERELFEQEFGNPICTDNIGECLEPVLLQQYQLLSTACGTARIKRRYAAIDFSLNLTVFSEQLITVNYTPDFQITFPADWEGACGDAFPEASLNLESQGCTVLGWTHTDELFESNEAGACQTIRRTFLVDNACSSNEEMVSITRESGEGKTISAELVRDATLYQYIQILKITNKELPEIAVADIETCILANNCQEERIFSITATDCVGSDSLHYQYELLNNGQVVLSGASNRFTTFVTNIPYEVNWGVTDFCGNTTWETFTYEFTDCKQPSPICFDGISVNIDENNEAVIWANDLHQKSNDNCSGEIVAVHLWHPNLTFEQPTLETSVETIRNLPQSLTLDCGDLGTQGVNIYVIDQIGNWDFCTASIDVQANNACNSVSEIQTALIAGKILTADAVPLSDVKLTIASDGTPSSTIYSNEDGQFSLEGTKDAPYNISFEKEGNLLNGVSTFDLVLISKHILSVELFDSPYQFVAADINQSNTITAFDLVVLRQMILRLHTEFPNNTNYRFVAADYSFSTNDPLVDSFVETIEIPSLSEDVTAMDFVAVKIGDVNGSANEDALLTTSSRSGAKVFLDITDQDVTKGEQIDITIKTSDLARIQSLQYSLLFEGLEILSIQEGVLQQDQLAVYQNREIGLSWNAPANANPTLAKESVLCTIHAQATEAGRLSQLLSISNTILPEAVDQQSTIVDIALRFESKPTFSLYQNQPNPFSEQTVIGFQLAEAGHVQLEIFSIAGNLLKEIDSYYEKGYNEITISHLADIQKGVLWYRMSTQEGVDTKKMIFAK